MYSTKSNGSSRQATRFSVARPNSVSSPASGSPATAGFVELTANMPGWVGGRDAVLLDITHHCKLADRRNCEVPDAVRPRVVPSPPKHCGGSIDEPIVF